MSFNLTISERYELMHHIARLPCTISLRYSIDEFNKLIDFTDDEINSKQITINKTTFDIDSNDSEYVVSYDKFPSGIVDAINKFILQYDIEETKQNSFVQNTLKLFKKVV